MSATHRGEVSVSCAGDLAGEAFDIGSGHDRIDHSEMERPFRWYRARGEEHLFEEAGPDGTHHVENSGGIVGYAELGRREREGCLRRGDHEVTGDGQFAGSAPDASLNHGDDWQGKGLDGAHEAAQRVLVAQRIPAGTGQLSDIVAR